MDYVKKLDRESLCLTFSEAEKIAGLPIDHSFLSCKKEQTVLFEKIKK